MNEAESLESVLRRFKLSVLEWWIMRLVGMWPIPRNKLALTTLNQLTRDEQSQFTVNAFEDAVNGCVNKGWLTIVDDAFLSKLEIGRRIKSEDPPIYGWPAIGDVDFTALGAKLFRRIRLRLFGAQLGRRHGFAVCLSRKVRVYCLSKESASDMYMNLKEDPSIISVTYPCHVDFWRLYWWDRRRGGYFIDFETRDVDREFHE